MRLRSALVPRAVLSPASKSEAPSPVVSRIAFIRHKRYSAFDSDLDKDALAVARKWHASFEPSQLPSGTTTYARSSGPGGQHVNKTETKAISVFPVKDLLAVIPPILHPSLRTSPYYTAGSDSLTFQAQTHRSRTANADENREKLVSVIRQLYDEAVPAETSSDKHAKYKEVTKRFHDSRLKDKKFKGSKKQFRRGGDIHHAQRMHFGFPLIPVKFYIATDYLDCEATPTTPLPLLRTASAEAIPIHDWTAWATSYQARIGRIDNQFLDIARQDMASQQGTASPQPAIQPCRYKVGKTLGAGSYSTVKECVHIDTGRYYAAKVINKRLMAGREHMVRNEIAVLKKVSMGHQNILTLIDYFETMNNLYLVTDLALGGELFDRICRKGSYFESDAADLIRATLSAVAYLHDHGIVHRDLKPENLLFRTPEDNADLLIADFGLSRIMDESQFHVLTTTCGTPGYMAPEIFKKTGHGKPVDLWALGVITYFLLCGYTPFDRDTDFEEMQAILKADYAFAPVEYWRGVSSHAKDFVRRCLTIDPARRITAHEALQHPFVTSDAPSDGAGENLLPTIKKNFNARRTLHAAIDTVRAINKLREAQHLMMDGAHSKEPSRGGGGGGDAHPPPAPLAAIRKDDSGIVMDSSSASSSPVAAAAAAMPPPPRETKDSGYSTQPEGGVATPPTTAAAKVDARGDGKMSMGSSIPAALQPGHIANKVIQTSKGLWGGSPVRD